MTATATVAIFEAPGRPFRLEQIKLPKTLADDEALIEISLATICGSDIHTVEGRRNEPTPAVLGHEGVGRVVAAGPGRTWMLGSRVTWTSASSCGQCAACSDYGLPQKCPDVFKYGHAPIADGCGLHGTYATHLLVRAGTTLIPLPGHVADIAAAPANCALATMAAVTEQLPRNTRVAVIQGAGLLGLLGCALLRHAGVPRVVVVDPNEARLTAVPSFGGVPAHGAALVPLRPGEADVVIEVAGNPAAVPEGLKLLRPGGHYLLAGMVHPDSAISVTGEELIRRCITLRGFHNYAPRHLHAAVEFLSRNPSIPWETLVSPAFPLSRIDEAFSLAASRRWPRVALQPET